MKDFDNFHVLFPIEGVDSTYFKTKSLGSYDTTLYYVVTTEGKLRHYGYEVEIIPYNKRENSEPYKIITDKIINNEYNITGYVVIYGDEGSFQLGFDFGQLTSIKTYGGAEPSDDNKPILGPQLLPQIADKQILTDYKEALRQVADYQGKYVSEEYSSSYMICPFCNESWSTFEDYEESEGQASGKLEHHKYNCPVPIARVFLGRKPYPDPLSCPLCGTLSWANSSGWDGSYNDFKKYSDYNYPERESFNKTVKGCCESCSGVYSEINKRHHEEWLNGFLDKDTKVPTKSRRNRKVTKD